MTSHPFHLSGVSFLSLSPIRLCLPSSGDGGDDGDDCDDGDVVGAIETVCPIFIVGAIRAGSTLLEQMLDLHPAIVGLDEVV